MKVVFMGTPDFSVGTLEALVEAGYEITGVVTQPDKPKRPWKTDDADTGERGSRKTRPSRSISRAACGMQRRSRKSGKWSRM